MAMSPDFRDSTYNMNVMSRDNDRFVMDNTLILQAEEAYNRKNNENVLEILSSHFFDKSHHEQLQHLWLAAIYARGEKMFSFPFVRLFIARYNYLTFNPETRCGEKARVVEK